MAEIYDFFSRKNFNKLIDHNHMQNKEIIMQHGRYIGVLTKQQTHSLRNTIDMLIFKISQVEMLMFEYEDLRSDYEEMVVDPVSFLEASKNGVAYNSEDSEFYVDQKGHCWVVKKNRQWIDHCP